MTDQIIDIQYVDGAYLHKTKTWHTEDSPYKAAIVNEAIKRNKIEFSHCADVGCGAGLVVEILSELNQQAEFTGFELSNDVDVFWSNRKKTKNLSFKHDNIVEQDQVFDLIICLDVFEHVEDYFLFLRSLKAVGKTFIFNVPLDMCVAKLLTSGIKNARRDVGHLHYFNSYTAKETISDTGYKIIDTKLSAAFLKIPPRSFRQAIALPIRLLSLIFGKSLSATLFGGMSLLIVAEPVN